MSAAPRDAIDELRGCLEQLLPLVRDPQVDRAGLARRLQRVNELEERVAAEVAAAEGLDEPARAALVERLEGLVRLNAIVREATDSERRRLGDDLARARKTGRDMRYYAPTDAAGRSCDVSG